MMRKYLRHRISARSVSAGGGGEDELVRVLSPSSSTCSSTSNSSSSHEDFERQLRKSYSEETTTTCEIGASDFDCNYNGDGDCNSDCDIELSSSASVNSLKDKEDMYKRQMIRKDIFVSISGMILLGVISGTGAFVIEFRRIWSKNEELMIGWEISEFLYLLGMFIAIPGGVFNILSDEMDFLHPSNCVMVIAMSLDIVTSAYELWHSDVFALYK